MLNRDGGKPPLRLPRAAARLAPLPVVAFAAVACFEGEVREPSLWDGPVAPGERRWLSTDWEPLWSAGGPADTLLHDPGGLRAGPDGVLVWDDGAFRLHPFDPQGRHRWSFGARGSGPGEFSQVVELQVGSRGQAYLHDLGNGRVTIVGPGGEEERMIPLGGLPHSGSMVVISDTLLGFVTSSDPERPLRVLDLEGREVHRAELPWEGFSQLTSLSRHGSTVSAGDRWVFALGLGNGWFAFRGLEPEGFVGGFVEHLELPRLVAQGNALNRTIRMLERPPCSACTLSIVDSLVVVHFGGRSDDEHRILDLHRWDDGSYVGSRLLPERAGWAVAREDRLYTLSADPFPTLSALRLRGSPAPDAPARR